MYIFQTSTYVYVCTYSSYTYENILVSYYILHNYTYLVVILVDCLVLNNSLGPTFAFSSGFIYEEKTALLFTDVFFNCSVDPIGVYTSWEFNNKHIINNHKYNQSISGLTIHNVTEEDQGHYICFIGHFDPLNATTSLNVVCKLSLCIST